MLTPWQKIVVENYGDGDYSHIETLDDSRDVGDGLFTFLMIELDPKEGCDDWPEGLSRLASARQQIEEIETLFKQHAPYITERQRDRDNPAKFKAGDRVYIRKVDKTKTVVSADRSYGHELRYVLKEADGTLDEGWREDELELVETDEELLDKAEQKHNATMLDGCETEDELNAELRAQTQGR
jgi:hypothetical protein